MAGRKAGERGVRAQHDGRVRRVPLEQAVQVNVLLRTEMEGVARRGQSTIMD